MTLAAQDDGLLKNYTRKRLIVKKFDQLPSLNFQRSLIIITLLWRLGVG